MPEAVVTALEGKKQGRKGTRHKSLREAGFALQRQAGYWEGHELYDTTERSIDSDAKHNGSAVRGVVDVDVPSREVHPSGVVTDRDWASIVAQRARPSGLPGNGPYPQPPEPLRPIERFIAADEAAVYRVGQAAHTLQQYNRSGPDLVAMTEAGDLRAAHRLKQIDRRAFALELVEMDHARIAARADPQQYLYHRRRSPIQKKAENENSIRRAQAPRNRPVEARRTSGWDRSTHALEDHGGQGCPAYLPGSAQTGLEAVGFDKLIAALERPPLA